MVSPKLFVFLILSVAWTESMAANDSLDNLVSRYIQLREHDKAINVLEKCDPLELDREKVKLLNRLYLITGKYRRGFMHVLKWGEPFQIAYTYEKMGAYEDALEFYKYSLYIFEDNKLYHMGECLFKLGRFREASLHYRRLVENFPRSMYADDALIKLATCYEKLRDYEQAISWWAKYEESPVAYYRMAKDYTKLGENSQAEALHSKLVSEFPASPYALKCLGKISEDPYNYGRVYFHNKHYTEATRYLKQLSTAEARKMFAQALFRLRRYKEAYNVFSELGLHYEAAECYRLLGEYDSALVEYSKVKDEHIDDAYFKMGEIYTKRGAFDKAISVYEKIPKSSSLYRMANRKKGLIELNISDLDPTLIGLRDTSEAAFLYWAHRAFLDLGNKSKADSLAQSILERHPFSYYAYLLQETNHESIITNTDVEDWVSSFADTSYRLSHDDRMHFEKAALLLEYGLKYEAIKEVKAIEENNPLFLYRLAKVFHVHGIDNYAIRYAKQLTKVARTNKIPKRILQILYPRRFSTTLGELNSIGDDFIILALIREESLFDPNAVSRSRALGLTQVIPSTGEAIAKDLGVQNFESKHLFDPYTNIRFGIYYFKQCLKRFDDSVELALLAYNGGPTRVAGWLSKGNSDSIDVFIENVPILEPRRYVKKVLGSYLAYRNIWGYD